MLTIGLVNNMAPAAVPATDRQFDRILSQAAKGIPFRLRRYRLAGARPDTYGTLDEMWDSELDGLIVTGAEPKTAALPDEAFWPAMTRTIEWATRHTSSAIWSCLAAHAAVLHLDRVQRRAQPAKIFGLFDSVKLAEHSLLRNVQASWRVPHSRWNDLPEADLLAGGYTILTHSGEAGVDIFCKQFRSSLFVFVQSHPEYEAASLIKEYRRDSVRHLSGHGETAPAPPKNCLDRDLPSGAPGSGGIDKDAPADGGTSGEWSAVVLEFYHNWLSQLLAARRQAGMAAA